MLIARLEIVEPSGSRLVALTEPTTTIGKGGADVVIHDRAASRLHAVIEQMRGGYVVQDLGSRNGTFVNGVRVRGPRALRSGDELRVGLTRLVFTSVVAAEELSATFPLRVAPDLTRRERDALIALCRPLLEHGMLSEPASVTSIAEQLVVTESAAKKLLGRLYDRFGLIDADRRRGRLALEALQTAAISPDDIDGT